MAEDREDHAASLGCDGPKPDVEHDWRTGSDAELLQSSDPEAFGAFYQRHLLSVQQFLSSRTGCPHVAADLTADTFAEALLHRSRYRGERGTARSWLFGIARNKLRHALRDGDVAARAVQKLEVHSVRDDLDRVDHRVDVQPLVHLIRARVDRLSMPVQDAVRLRVMDELPYAEVATRLGCSPGTARVRVARGIRLLGGDAVLARSWLVVTAPESTSAQ